MKHGINWLFDLEKKLHPARIHHDCRRNLFGFSHLIEDLTIESNYFRMRFYKLLDRSSKNAKILLSQAILLSNKIYNYLKYIANIQENNDMMKDIRKCYLQVLNVLEKLIEECAKFNHDFFMNLELTSFSLPTEKMKLRKQLEGLKKRFENKEIEPELTRLIVSELRLFIARQKLTRNDIEYIRALFNVLNNTSPRTANIENLLFQLNFNSPLFFLYFTKKCNELLNCTGSLHEQLDLLIGMEDNLQVLPSYSLSSFFIEKAPIITQIRCYLKDKKQLLVQKIKIRRAEIKDSQLSEEMERMQINLPVSQFGFLIRIFIEKGLIPKEDIGKTFVYYAKHFRTPKTPFISPESLQKKSTDVEYATAKKMKSQLIEMVNWINENYSSSH